MDMTTRVQILDETECISHSTNTLGQTGFSALVRQLVKEKENSKFKLAKLRLKIDLVSYPARAAGLINTVIIIIYTARLFHISFSWWFFTIVCVRASPLTCPGFFSVFWPFLIMLLFGWSPVVLQSPSPPVSLIILWWLYQKHQSRLV